MLNYEETLRRTDAPAGSSWGLFGPGDELGTLNFLTPERVARAAGLVHSGAVFNLDLPLDAFPRPVTHREAPKHTVFSHAAYHRDDKLDGFYLQGTTQIDGLRHFKHPEHGFYNFTPDDAVTPDGPRLGINRMAERGIVGRGVLLDLAGYAESTGSPVDHAGPTAFTVEDLEAATAAQGVALELGDVLLLRTGWISYVESADDATIAAIRDDPVSPGLAQSTELVAWLWDHQISLLAADNLGVEVLPTVRDSPFRDDPSLAALAGRHTGMVHPVLLGLLGMPLGELWFLDDLAADCHRDGRWDFLLTASPLNVVGGVGSPANAMAIK